MLYYTPTGHICTNPFVYVTKLPKSVAKNILFANRSKAATHMILTQVSFLHRFLRQVIDNVL